MDLKSIDLKNISLESIKSKLDDVLVKPIGARQVLDKLQQYCG